MTNTEFISLVLAFGVAISWVSYKLGETNGYVKGFRRAREILGGDYEDEYFNDGF